MLAHYFGAINLTFIFLQIVQPSGSRNNVVKKKLKRNQSQSGWWYFTFIWRLIIVCFLYDDKLKQKSCLLPLWEMHKADATWSRICSAIAFFFITRKITVMAFYITLLLPLTCGFYPAVCCCQLLNNSGHGFCNTFHVVSTNTSLQLKPSVVLGLFSKADLILGWI